LKLLDEKQGLKFTSGIWQNLSTFNKTLSYIGVNPMRFKDFDLAKENGALKMNIENEIMFFPTKIRFDNDSLQKGLLWGVEGSINKVSEKTKLEKIYVGYNEFNAHITNSSNEEQWVLLNQNYHHLWAAYYNDHSLPIEKVNDMIMGVKIPENSTGQLSFVFESSRTIYLFVISLLGYIFIAGYLIKNNYFIGNETE